MVCVFFSDLFEHGQSKRGADCAGWRSRQKSPSSPASDMGTPSLPTKIIPAKIASLKLSRKLPMCLGIPPLNIKILLESNPPKSRILVQRLAVRRSAHGTMSWEQKWACRKLAIDSVRLAPCDVGLMSLQVASAHHDVTVRLDGRPSGGFCPSNFVPQRPATLRLLDQWLALPVPSASPCSSRWPSCAPRPSCRRRASR